MLNYNVVNGQQKISVSFICMETFQIVQQQTQMFKFTEVTVCKNASADNIDYSHPDVIKKSISGDLQILLQTTTGMMLLKLKDFQYGINPNQKVIYEDKDPNFKLLLCLDSNPQNVWILKINENCEMLHYMLSERCQLIHRRASKIIVRESQEQNKYPELKEPQKFKYTPERQEGKQPMSTTYKLVQASKSFSQLLVTAGHLFSQGFEAIGTAFSKKVDPSANITLSPTTKLMIEKSVNASKKLLQYSTQKFAGIFRMATNQVIGLESTISGTDYGKKLNEKGTIEQMKKNVRVGLQAITNVYDGFIQGYDEAAKGFSKGANQVISAKYGKDAGDATLKVAESYRNVNKISGAPSAALKQVLLETARNHIKQK